MAPIDDVKAFLLLHGLETEQTAYGLRGELECGGRRYLYKIGRANDGGDDVSVRPLPEGPTWWFWRENLEGIARLLLDARARVEEGQAKSWLEALRHLDSTMSALWPDDPDAT
ncbi:hypothetical protein HRD49_40860 [Corallococcus exiguus]|uniref:hypothetical protein n=1 Tax=Corallococcus TaxID=83461 RepID=UPI000F889E17|nr:MULTISPECIES: hypothetical protein [Corallococcus]NNC22202.1 hypothetical protein [Corallococcus exiguus]NRD59224.1 hypothetical protein [Corallococcus exiguus]NRD68099.1 hypothetical protein [Corallococcus exiguus]